MTAVDMRPRSLGRKGMEVKNLRDCCHRWKATLAVSSLAWVAFIVWRTVTEAPVLSTNVRPDDFLSHYEFRTALISHYLKAAILALGVPLVAYGVGFLACRYAGASISPATAAERTDSGPGRILLMRHAEKPGDKADLHLSDAGKARAERLATYIPKTFGKPDFIFAAAPTNHSLRSIETVTPLAAALGIEVHHDIEDANFEDLVAELYSNPVYSGKTIVICWHHGKLPEIATLLGAAEGSYPSPWPQGTFNLILDFVYPQTAEVPPSVTEVVQPF